ncbi:CPW-WPC family protein, putative [Plasmodium relictum]|uniref:CPW-WPC family protein, putative n=1 Tax=Plasmodium relictum TaxID=85471 RepID=A0A1J1H7S9_PLARL|nr:CPW-WPC family protein, putative [Plasmodium relictum]CRH00837.1 CPW-WPC family protein, putative [Plasmodium relictum]
MKYMSIIFLYFFYFIIQRIDCYKKDHYSFLNTKSNKNISKDLNELNKINEELVTNEKEDDDDEDEELENSDFDDLAHKSLENAEEQATIDLENAEIENLLDNEIFRIIQERLKKLWYIGKCRRDYSSVCPLGWRISTYDENLCIPPDTYEGLCRSIDFSNSSNTDKELFAWKCEVEWPCVNSPKLKVMGKCPLRWTSVGNNLCVAPEDYVGKCPPAINLSNYDYEMRVRWANECNVEWISQPKTEYAITHEKILRYSGGPIEESGNVVKIIHKK